MPSNPCQVTLAIEAARISSHVADTYGPARSSVAARARTSACFRSARLFHRVCQHLVQGRADAQDRRYRRERAAGEAAWGEEDEVGCGAPGATKWTLCFTGGWCQVDVTPCC